VYACILHCILYVYNVRMCTVMHCSTVLFLLYCTYMHECCLVYVNTLSVCVCCVLHSTALHWTVLYCTVCVRLRLCRTALYNTVLYSQCYCTYCMCMSKNVYCTVCACACACASACVQPQRLMTCRIQPKRSPKQALPRASNISNTMTSRNRDCSCTDMCRTKLWIDTVTPEPAE
jgi:hypothetical protein